jgi:hypothetical protein
MPEQDHPEGSEDEKVFIDLLDPKQSTLPRRGNDRELILIFLCLFFSYMVFKKSMAVYTLMMNYDNIGWGFKHTFLSFFPVVALLAGIVLFWRRKKAGWILSTFVTAFSSAAAIQNAIITYSRDPRENRLYNAALYYTPPLISVVTALAIAVIIWLLCRPSVREVYGIDRLTMLIVLAASILLVPVILLLL